MTRRLSLSLLAALAVGCAAEVKPPNPSVTVVGDVLSVATGTLVQVDGSKSTDPQNLTLSFRWFLKNVPAGSQARLNATDVMSPSFLADLTGEYEVALVVSNGIYSSGAISAIITAEPCGGHAPQVSKITFQQGTSTASTSFDVASADAGTPDAGGVTVDAGDTTDAGGSDAGPVDGGPVDAGTTDAGPRDAGPQALFRELETVKLIASIVDPDTDPKSCTPAAPAIFTYQWSLQAPAGSTAVLSDPTSATPTFAPDVPGNYIAAVQATDLSGRTGPLVSTVLNVANCGDHAPTISLATSVLTTVNGHPVGSGTASLNNPVSLVASGTDTDNTIDPVTHLNCNPTGESTQTVSIDWAFLAVPFGSHAALNVSSIPTGAEGVSSTAVFFPDVPGNYYVRLTGSDSTGRAADPSVIIINVGGCTGNHPPVATVRFLDTLGTPRTIGDVNQLFGLYSGATDADNANGCQPPQALTYQWSLVAQPTASHATLNNPTLPVPGFVPDVPGTYTARVVVTDSTGLSSTPAVGSITISNATTCGSPSITTQTATANVTWQQTAQVQVNNGLLSQNPTCTGSCVTLFTANDADPSCIPGLNLSYQWSFDSLPLGSHAAFLNSTVQNPSFVPDVANADYLVRLTVTDTRGLSATATAKLHTPAQGANAPRVTFTQAISTLTFSGSNPATLTGGRVGVAVPLTVAQCTNNQAQVTDADDNTSICNGNPGTYSYAWSLVSAPAGSSAAILNATTSAASIIPDVVGSYRVRLVVTDTTGLSSAPADIVISNVGVDLCSTAKPTPAISVLPGGSAIVGVSQLLTASVSNVDSSNYYLVNNARVCSAPELFSYRWVITARPAGSSATLQNADSAQASLTPDVASGSWTVAAIVSDASGAIGTATQTITTTTCGAQNPTISNVVAGADFNSYNGAITGSDPSVTWDGNGNTSSGSAVFQLGVPVSFNATARDNDNSCGAGTQTLTYTWALQSLPAGSAATLVSSGATASIIPDAPSNVATANLTADYKVALTVTDSTGRSTTSTFAFATSNCGSFSPTVTNILATNTALSGSPAVGSATTFTPTISDANVSSCLPAAFRLPATYSYEWQLSAAPARSTATLTGADRKIPSLIPDFTGTYEVSVKVTDLSGHSSPARTATITP